MTIAIDSRAARRLAHVITSQAGPSTKPQAEARRRRTRNAAFLAGMAYGHAPAFTPDNFVMVAAPAAWPVDFATTDTAIKPPAAPAGYLTETLYLMGYRNVNVLAATAGLLWSHLAGDCPPRLSRGGVGRGDIIDTIEGHPGLVESVRFAYAAGNFGAHSVVALCHYLFTRQDPRAAGEFFGKLTTGVDLKPTSAIYHLRNRILGARTGASPALSSTQVMALFFKAWNLSRAGIRVTRLAWRSTGVHAESFPTIDD